MKLEGCDESPQTQTVAGPDTLTAPQSTACQPFQALS
jgi:hypothetical protein